MSYLVFTQTALYLLRHKDLTNFFYTIPDTTGGFVQNEKSLRGLFGTISPQSLFSSPLNAQLFFLFENRGKSGSVRVCYTDFEEFEVIYLITAFEKKDQENLTDAEKNTLRKFVKALRDAEAERRKIKMTSLFDDLKKGLQEAIVFAKGEGPAKVTRFEIEPVITYTNAEIREIRTNAKMTQAVFALYIGVSTKTVEAWESGRTHPTGPACRLMTILAEGKQQPDFVKVRLS